MKNEVSKHASFAAVLGLAVAACAGSSVSGQDGSLELRSPTQDAASQPARQAGWGREVLRVHAKGVQVYRVASVGDGEVAFRFLCPKADLFDDEGRLIGTHFLTATGPVWEFGGVRITGTKIRERPSPNAGAIPELQLSAAAPTTGELAGVTLVERLDTLGGAAPSLYASHHEGDTVEVPYTADYAFYAAGR